MNNGYRRSHLFWQWWGSLRVYSPPASLEAEGRGMWISKMSELFISPGGKGIFTKGEEESYKIPPKNTFFLQEAASEKPFPPKNSWLQVLTSCCFITRESNFMFLTGSSSKRQVFNFSVGVSTVRLHWSLVDQDHRFRLNETGSCLWTLAAVSWPLAQRQRWTVSTLSQISHTSESTKPTTARVPTPSHIWPNCGQKNSFLGPNLS